MSRRVQYVVCSSCGESWPVAMVQDKRGDGSWYVEDDKLMQCPECGSGDTKLLAEGKIVHDRFDRDDRDFDLEEF